MRLVIISHTEHYKTTDGKIVGWGPTIREINHLAPHFESITHVAMLHKSKAPPSAAEYTENNIHFEVLPALGGTSVLSKLKTIGHIPKVIGIVNRLLKEADAFQLRTPTGIGVFLIPYLTLFSKKKGWYKYAGNWNQKNPPLGYRLQRWLLKKQSRLVTINGQWQGQPRQCLTFENPCLTDEDVLNGKDIVTLRRLEDKLNFCYVGRLETPKGVGRIIDAFMSLSKNEKSRVGQVHLIGDGNEKAHFEEITKLSDIDFRFHGYLSRSEVFDIYKKNHFFLMPTSASEGFPKVIAEASNFGCMPVVSSVSAIAQYVKHGENGLIVSPISAEGLKLQLDAIFNLDDTQYQNLLKHSQDFVKQFTFNHYINRILTEILS
ncbi:glycosyltransferase family 4 protein [Winogradskyella haliclonae]|uniref:Glycosyl transferase n=1 Tax=Winogradskyella haliclonae TaxID=2048558 RepID=A0ABQ2C1D4_9FLAO|nr:glycosyltransferase family 4 protein [Winogradskyella haliclonae]GGI58025.1 glycosyl transferase [Winogradskyella haliclonae]